MIPYEELSAALERWRVKNGLPGTPPLFAEGSTMKRPAAAAAPVPSYSAPSYSAPPYSAPSYGSGPLYSPPAATTPPPAPAPRVPPPPSPETLDEAVDEFAEDDVLAEAELDNDGPDFAMAFSDAPPAGPPSPIRAPLSADEEREATLIGSTDTNMAPPRSPATANVVDDDDADEYNAADKTPT